MLETFGGAGATAVAVAPNTVVSFHYTLADEKGSIVAQTDGEPARFVVGHAQTPPAVEEALLGRVPGDKLSIQLEPDDAFGDHDADAIIEVDRSEFGPELAVGEELEAEAADGRIAYLKVVAITPDHVALDTNHPLAGQNVQVSLEIQQGRPATEDELADLRLEAKGLPGARDMLPAERLLRRPPSG